MWKSVFVHISCIVWLPEMYHGDGSLNYGALNDFSTGSIHETLINTMKLCNELNRIEKTDD
jgi:hypothetical protein